MSFPWPAIDEEAIFEQALGIALRHFDLPHDEAEYADVESRAGHTIMEDWRRGKQGSACQQGDRRNQEASLAREETAPSVVSSITCHAPQTACGRFG
jgi:hypothetical protein